MQCGKKASGQFFLEISKRLTSANDKHLGISCQHLTPFSSPVFREAEQESQNLWQGPNSHEITISSMLTVKEHMRS